MAREKPAVTIRLLRRQLSTAQATVAALQLDRSDKEKVIAGYDVQLSESDETERTLRNRVADQAVHIGELNARLRQKSERLAYLEGYFYAKEAISAPSSPLPRHSAEAQARERAGDTQDLPHRRQGGQGTRENEGTPRPSPRPGDPVWRQRSHDFSDTEKRQVEHIEITDGIS